jgi:hypothetical protein
LAHKGSIEIYISLLIEVDTACTGISIPSFSAATLALSRLEGSRESAEAFNDLFSYSTFGGIFCVDPLQRFKLATGNTFHR